MVEQTLKSAKITYYILPFLVLTIFLTSLPMETLFEHFQIEQVTEPKTNEEREKAQEDTKFWVQPNLLAIQPATPLRISEGNVTDWQEVFPPVPSPPPEVLLNQKVPARS